MFTNIHINLFLSSFSAFSYLSCCFLFIMFFLFHYYHIITISCAHFGSYYLFSLLFFIFILVRQYDINKCKHLCLKLPPFTYKSLKIILFCSWVIPLYINTTTLSFNFLLLQLVEKVHSEKHLQRSSLHPKWIIMHEYTVFSECLCNPIFWGIWNHF